MGRIKTYIINLPKDLERKESILKKIGQLSCLDIELIKAVYGKELADEEKEKLFNKEKYVRYYGRFVLPGEIGCTLSHRKCYQRLLDSEQEFVLILEDDARFVDADLSSEFIDSISDFMNTSDPTVLLLHSDFDYVGKKVSFCNKYSLYRVHDALFATAYLINKNAARLLLQKRYPYWVADDWRLFRRWGIRIYSLYPSVVIQQWDRFTSSILEKRTFKPERLWPRSFLECCLAFRKLHYLFLKRLGVIKHLKG